MRKRRILDMRNKGIMRLTAVFLALMLCVGAFSMTAFAYGGDTENEITGGLEPEAADTEDDPETEGAGDAGALTEKAISDLLSALIGAQGNIAVTEDGIEITSEGE